MNVLDVKSPDRAEATGPPQGAMGGYAGLRRAEERGVPVTPKSAEPPRLSERSGLPQKAPGADLRRYYRLTFLAALVLALLVVIALFHWQIRFEPEFEALVSQQEVVQIEEIKPTKQEIKPPPPPHPPVPVEVPNDRILDDVELDLDATLDIDEPLTELPPPLLRPRRNKKWSKRPSRKSLWRSKRCRS